MGRKPRTRKYTRSSFYAQDFTRDISVRTVRRHCHSTKHGLSYTKPGDTKHYWHILQHNRHADRDQFNSDGNKLNHRHRNNFHHRLRFNGNIANQPTRNHLHRQPFSNSGYTRRCGQRRIGNRRNPEQHSINDWNFYHGNLDHRGAMHASEQRQHWNVNHGEQHAFKR